MDSECYVKVSVWVRSLLRASLAEQQRLATPGVAHLPEGGETSSTGELYALRIW